MGHITIQNGDLSPEQVLHVFRNGLADHLDARKSALPAVDFIVRRSALIGVGVKLQHKGGGSRLRCAPMIPSTLLRMLLLNGLVSSLFVWPVLRRTLREVEAFVAASPELSGEGPSAAPGSPVASAPSRSQPSDARPAHAPLIAAWIGITALLVPSITNLFFGYADLVIDRWAVTRAVVTAVAALALTRFMPAAVARRPMVIGISSWLISGLALAAFTFGVRLEIDRWFTPYGAAEIAIVAASLFALAMVINNSEPKRTPSPVSAHS